MTLATVEDLEPRWRPLSDAEKSSAMVKLGTASRHLLAVAPDIPDRITAGTLDPDLVVDVVCEMVKRAMTPAGGELLGVASTQIGGGPFQESVTYRNPMGDLYLTKAEKRVLGIGGQVAFTVPMGPPVEDDPLGWLQ